MMNKKVQRLGFAFGGALLLTVLWVRLVPGGPTTSVAEPSIMASPSPVGTDISEGAEPSPTMSPDASAIPEVPVSTGSPASELGTSTGLLTYAVNTFELQGFPPDAEPGTKLEIWAAWEPPVVKAPRYQRILREVTLEKVVAGLTPESPATALLLVRPQDLAKLIYADRWGALTVAILP